MKHDGWSFLCGWAVAADRLFFARERDDLAAQDSSMSTFYVWDGRRPDAAAQWSIYHEVARWRAIGMASVKPGSAKRIVVALGANGQYFELEPAGPTEHVGQIENLDVLTRRVAAIGDDIFATGMGRSVIRRVRRGVWTEFGPGVTPSDQDRVVGFEGIDGFSPDDIYVAGWAGEIWRWLRNSWRRIDCPTNANLNAVACARDNGLVFAVGDNGSMLRGSGDEWAVIDTGRWENLQDVVVFEEEVFAVTDFEILRLGPDGLLPDERFAGGDRPETCLHLLPAEDGVISMGPKDLFAFTGQTWRRII